MKLIFLINSPKNPYTWWLSPKNFSWISRELFWRNSEKFCGEKFWRISQDILEIESQNCDPTKISHLGDQFWGISREFPRNQLQEMILEKFLGNFSKEVTTAGESWEIPHFCYLGNFWSRNCLLLWYGREGFLRRHPHFSTDLAVIFREPSLQYMHNKDGNF